MALFRRGALLLSIVLLSGCWDSDAASSGSASGFGGGNGGSAGGGSFGGGSGGNAPSCGQVRFPDSSNDAGAAPVVPASEAGISLPVDAAVDAAAGPIDGSVDGAVGDSDAAVHAGADAGGPDGGAGQPEPTTFPSCGPDAGFGMPIHGAPCQPRVCSFMTVSDCVASCNTCTDGIARWVTACGPPLP